MFPCRPSHCPTACCIRQRQIADQAQARSKAGHDFGAEDSSEQYCGPKIRSQCSRHSLVPERRSHLYINNLSFSFSISLLGVLSYMYFAYYVCVIRSTCVQGISEVVPFKQKWTTKADRSYSLADIDDVDISDCSQLACPYNQNYDFQCFHRRPLVPTDDVLTPNSWLAWWLSLSSYRTWNSVDDDDA